MTEEYGHIEVKGHNIVRMKDNKILYDVPIKDIRLIGEYTTADGPYLDDWFLVIVTSQDWYEIPMDIVNIDKMLRDLEKLLGTNLDYQLTKSTKWRTRIIYPEASRDKEIYEVVGLEPKIFWDKVKKLIGLQPTVRQFSAEAKKWISD
jgi:hypothetical protein